MDQIYGQRRMKAGSLGLDDIEITISVIPSQMYRYGKSRLRWSWSAWSEIIEGFGSKKKACLLRSGKKDAKIGKN